MLLLATSAWAELPVYQQLQLQARSAIGPGFNVPNGASINSATVSINNSSVVAFRIALPSAIPGDEFTRHIWIGSNGSGGVLSEGPAGSLVSDPSIDVLGRVWFAVNIQGGGANAGIYRFDPGGGGSTTRLTGLPLGASFYSTPIGNSNAQAGYRAGFGAGQAWVSFGAGNVDIHATEVGIDASSPYSFLFTPSFDEQRVIAGKLTLHANGFNQIRTIDGIGTATILARSNAEDASSMFFAFDNSVALAPTTGRVAFIATLASGGGAPRGVFRADSVDSVVEIARTGTGVLNGIEFFAPAVNDDGLVVFRGVDSAGKQAIFVGDGEDLRRVIGRGDAIATDLGTGQIDQETPGSPAFSGGVAINSNGDVAFSPALTPFGNNQIEWGTGVYIAYASSSTDAVFANGFENP